MKNKIIYILCAIMIFVSIYMITDTYGLFESNKTKVVDSQIAKWNILINETNINKTESFLINTFKTNDTSTVESGKIAPGVTGYFDIAIDPSDTEVSFRYDLTFDFSSLSNSFTIESIEETNGYSIVRTDEFTYSNIITLTDIKNGIKNNIRVHIKWQNNEENNATDTVIGMNPDYSIEIPVTITTTQYFNETLEPYVEPVIEEQE